MSQYFTATQPMTESLENCTPPKDYEQAWGRFYPISINVKNYINLCMDKFTIGRSPLCDYQLTEEHVGERFYNCVSNFHFEVTRQEPEKGVFVVLLKDTSSNGTYVNGKCIGRDQFVILSDKDQIGIAASTCNVFLYQDLDVSSYCEYPSEISDHYAIFNQLGKGGYGEVRLVFKKDTTERFAMKTIDVKPIEQKKIIKEFVEPEILRKLNHPNIVKMFNMSLVEHHLYIFLEYLHGGDLGKYVSKRGKLPEDTAKHIFLDILKGVNYLHDNNVLHRDLKPGNILLSSDSDFPRAKISDFGLSKVLEGPALVKTRCGTTSYAPPELQYGAPGQVLYDFRSDIWSLGVILYYILSGILPFRRDRKDMLMDDQIKNAKYSFTNHVQWVNLSRPVEMIRKCLRKRLQERCFVGELLADEWFLKEQPTTRKRSSQSQNKENSSSSSVTTKRMRAL